MSPRGLACAVLLVAAAALPPAAGCFVGGFDLAQAVPAGGGGSGVGAGPTGGGPSGGGGATGCQPATWPQPPASSDPGADTVDLVVASYDLDFGETDLAQGALVGYDLDSRCTCLGDGASCKEPPWATDDHCDGPGGRDNATAELFGVMGQFDPDFTSAKYSADAKAGKAGLLLRVRDYNGQPNDTQVTVSLHPSPGMGKDPCNGPDPTPAWDGSDRWPVAATSLNGGGAGGAGGAGGGGGGDPCGNQGYDIDDARYLDAGAYVSGGVLVANLPEVALVFVSGSDAVPIKLTAGFVTGTLEQQTDGWHVRDGLLVGRWKLEEFFRLIGSITSQGLPICTDHAIYPFIKDGVCKYPDIASTLGGPTTPCDAISFGLSFTAKPAKLGAVYVGASGGTLCPPETDPANDSCG